MSDDDASPVPLLDLAPKLDRPLSLWNPLDYLRVLYWVFFFPQALRWYADVFGVQASRPPAEETSPREWERLWSFLASPTPQRNLVLQGLILTILAPMIMAVLLQVLGVPVAWLMVAVGGSFGVAMFVIASMNDVATAVVSGVVGAITAGGTLGVAGGVVGDFALDISGSLAFGMAVGVVCGLWLSIRVGAAGGVVGSLASILVFHVALGVALGALFGVMAGVVVGLASDVLGGMLAGALSGLACGATFIMTAVIANVRLPGFGLAALGLAIAPPPFSLWSRVTPLPLPGLERRLLSWLRADPARGLANLDQILRFSLQQTPAINAVNQWLATTPEAALLPTVELLAREPFDYDLVQRGSASLRELRVGAKLRFDTPARAACAGFWALHELKLATAVTAFQNVRHLPGGDSLYNAAEALNAAPLAGADLTAIAAWADKTTWLTHPWAESWESVVVGVARRLRDVALEAAVARDSSSRLNRNAALNRAGGMLTNLLADLVKTYPQLVWPITYVIATHWREALSKAGGEIGQLAITAPVPNPFVVGDPVTGQLFAGREAIMRQLEELWSSDPAIQAPSVVLYGHRRMGKTSILHNLGKRFGRETVVVPFTMQRVGRVRDTGELLHALALWLRDALDDAGLPAPAEPEEAAFARNYSQAFNRFLREARGAIDGRRVILTIDEFEAIEEGIREGRIEAGLLDYLRGVIQGERWLVLAFAGLHTLREMTGDYWNPLFGSVTPIKVGFLSLPESNNLLANPHDDFPLDFTRAAAGRVYDHARGQPYLTQLIGRTLVSRYNRELFEEQRAREPRFTPEEVDAVVESAEFYETADAYFSGVWGQAGDARGPGGQQALLLALARAEGLAALDDLAAAAGLSPEAAGAALEALERHDVVARDGEGRVAFTVPLMRRWVQQNKSE